MKKSTLMQRLLDANADKLKSEGKIIKFSSGTDNLVLEISGEDCIIYIEGTEPTIKEWANNFAVPRIPFEDAGWVEIGFMLNVYGLVGSMNDLMSLVSIVSTLNGSITIVGNSRAGVIAKLVAVKLFKLGIPKNRFKLIMPIGCPMSGNSDFRRYYNRLFGNVTTTINGRFDLITFVPPWGNQHGELIKINTWLSHKLTTYIKRQLKIESK